MDRSDKKKKAPEPEATPPKPFLCKNCKRDNLNVIRSFKLNSCEHFDEDTHSEGPEEEEEKPEEQLDDVGTPVEEAIPE